MSNFLASLEKLAMTAGTLLGGPIVPAALEIGKDVLNLLHKAKTVVDTNDVPALDAMIAELEPKVLAHADATEASLRGG